MTIKECKAKEKQLAEQQSQAREKLKASMKELARKIYADVKIHLEENDEEDIGTIRIKLVDDGRYQGAPGVCITDIKNVDSWHFSIEELEGE